MSLDAGTRLGPYEITAKLGEGGMGEVYRARDARLERDVAIKVLPAAFVEDPDRLARFEREAKLLAQLNHPQVAQIYGMEASGDAHALVMELVEGPTLAERLVEGPLPIDESLAIARQIAEALEEAHDKGIIHRDLKPQNIKASREGKVKVLDFGLAKAMDTSGSPSGVTSGGASGVPSGVATPSELAASPTLTLGVTVEGVILGTAAYMAPEQAAGGAADRRADIWSFGVVLYEMLSGRRLFVGETVSHILAGVLKDEPDFSALPAGVPPRIRRLLHRCLRKKPRERLQAIGEPFAGDPTDIVVQLSPDGKRATMVLTDPRTASSDSQLWLVELATGARQRLPFVDFDSPIAAWSPDGRDLFVTDKDKAVVVPVAGGASRPVSSPHEMFVPRYTPDGTWIVYYTVTPQTGLDIFRVAVDGGSAPDSLVREPGQQTSPDVSPDGRFLAYESDESGRQEIYVRPFPDGNRKWQVSTGGGASPIWNRQGGELVWLADNAIWSAPVSTAGGSFEAGAPRIVIRGDAVGADLASASTYYGRVYDLSSDGRQFLVVQRAGDGRNDIVFVENPGRVESSQ